MTFTTTDGVKLNYKVEGEGKPIVLVHGWSGNLDNFTPMLEKLSENNKVVVYDHRGHGYSDHPQYGITLDRLAKDLKELLDHLELENVLLVGWSMGALTLFDYVRQFGTEGLEKCIIVDMTPKLLNNEEWKLGLYDGSYEIEDADKDLSQMFDRFDLFFADFSKKALPYATDELLLEMAKQAAESEVPAPSLLALCGLWHAMVVSDYREDLKAIDVPTRIFRGSLKSLYPRETAEYIAERIPGTEIIEFENATHMLMVENPKKATEEILAFLDE